MNPATAVPTLRTVGVIARELGEPLHRISYVLRTRPILPTARAGRLRLYDREAVGMIRNAITSMRAKGVPNV